MVAIGKSRMIQKFVSCSATVSNMGEMLTLINSWFFFFLLSQAAYGVSSFYFHMQHGVSKDEFKVKTKQNKNTKRNVYPYHLWTNFIITCLEDERGRR